MSFTFLEFQQQVQTNPTMAVVVNINVDHQLIAEARHSGQYVYIGKTSEWGNPYQVVWDGSQEEIIEKYKDWLTNQPKLMAKLPLLRGKVLGCYCAPRACHGDVLVDLLKER